MYNHKEYYQVCVIFEWYIYINYLRGLYELNVIPERYTCTYLSLEVIQFPGEVLDLVLEVLLLRLVELELRLQCLVLLVHSSNLIGAYMVLQVHVLNPIKRRVYLN